MAAWDPLTNPIDFVLVSGQQTPGVAHVEKASSPRKWDEIGGYGADGAVAVFHGRKLSAFDVVIRLYTPEHWAAWDAWKPLVMRLPKSNASKAAAGALDVWHPWLEALGIKSAVVTDVGKPEEIDSGGYRIVVSFLEYRRPRLTLAAPTAAESKPQQSQDPTEKLIDQLVGQVQELAKTK